MESVWFEIIFIFTLILINGFFVGSEIAVVSARRSRINQMTKDGRIGAPIVAGWLKEPEVFLATVQIVVTMVGALASALGGAAAIVFLKPRIERIDLFSSWAEPISIAMVVVMITYISLVMGELVPKSLALIYRERMATKVAVPIHFGHFLLEFFPVDPYECDHERDHQRSQEKAHGSVNFDASQDAEK